MKVIDDESLGKEFQNALVKFRMLPSVCLPQNEKQKIAEAIEKEGYDYLGQEFFQLLSKENHAKQICWKIIVSAFNRLDLTQSEIRNLCHTVSVQERVIKGLELFERKEYLKGGSVCQDNGEKNLRENMSKIIASLKRINLIRYFFLPKSLI